MTIIASFDGCHTWPEIGQIMHKEAPGFGYFCMTMADENTIGTLYEGVKDLFFRKILVS